MPRCLISIPKYRRKKSRNLAVVSFDHRDVYLGPWKSRRSRELYDQLIAVWLQHGRNLPDDVLANFCVGEVDVHVHMGIASPPAPPSRVEIVSAGNSDDISLAALAEEYNRHAEVYYRKNGLSTREAGAIAEALTVSVELFGAEPASEFGPLRFQQVRDAMVGKGWSRPYVNKQCGRIKRAFRWSVTIRAGVAILKQVFVDRPRGDAK